MAVYTKITKHMLESFLENYDLGKLLSFIGIQEGVENTNYKLIMSTGSYIFTIFEKRVNENELPFFVELKNHLFKKNFLCPKPISNKDGIYINKIKNKPCLITTFLNGKKVKFINELHCQQLGKQIALMHINTSDLKIFRENNLSQNYWAKLFDNFKYNKNNKYKYMFKIVEEEINFLENNWPKKLPSGIIHSDVFHDNVFFDNNFFSGIIDFYFACYDFYSYELAICINAWCFNSQNKLDVSKSLALLHSYQNYRKISKIEQKTFPIVLRGAAMRFLLTRLNDSIFYKKKSYVKIKDPLEYFQILLFHKNNNTLSNFGF